MTRSIKVHRRKYFLYETYKTKKEAIKVAKWYKKKNRKNKTFILRMEEGFLFPKMKYGLYMTKIRKIW